MGLSWILDPAPHAYSRFWDRTISRQSGFVAVANNAIVASEGPVEQWVVRTDEPQVARNEGGTLWRVSQREPPPACVCVCMLGRGAVCVSPLRLDLGLPRAALRGGS